MKIILIKKFMNDMSSNISMIHTLYGNKDLHHENTKIEEHKQCNDHEYFEDMYSIEDININASKKLFLFSYDMKDIWIKKIYKLFYNMIICLILYHHSFFVI